MPWIRTALMTSLGLGLACTRDNPAFQEEVGDGESIGESSAGESTTLAEESGTTASESATATTTDTNESTSTQETTTEDPPTDLPSNACESDLHEGLELLFADPFYLGGMCPNKLTIHGRINYDPVSQTTRLKVCQDLDALCLGFCGDGVGAHPFGGDFDLSGWVNECVTLEVANPIANDGDICSWSSVAAYQADNLNLPLTIAVTNGADPPDAAKLLLNGYPMLHEIAPCSCDSLNVDNSCCEPSSAAHFYEFVLPNLSKVLPGSGPAKFDVQGVPYSLMFTPIQAQLIGSCELASAWKLSAG